MRRKLLSLLALVAICFTPSVWGETSAVETIDFSAVTWHTIKTSASIPSAWSVPLSVPEMKDGDKIAFRVTYKATTSASSWTWKDLFSFVNGTTNICNFQNTGSNLWTWDGGEMNSSGNPNGVAGTSVTMTANTAVDLSLILLYDKTSSKLTHYAVDNKNSTQENLREMSNITLADSVTLRVGSFQGRTIGNVFVSADTNLFVVDYAVWNTDYQRAISSTTEPATWSEKKWGTTNGDAPTSGNAILVASDKTTLTLDASADLTFFAVSGAGEVAIVADSTEGRKLDADGTIISADTDVSGITANLGNVTVADGVTLTVGENTTFTRAASTGTVKFKGTWTGDKRISVNGNSYYGAVELAENATLEMYRSGGNVRYNVTGAGQSSKLILSSNDAWGDAENETNTFRDLTLEIASSCSGNFWLRSSRFTNGTNVHLVANHNITFEDNTTTAYFLSLSGLGNLAPNSGNPAFVIYGDENATYEGAFSGASLTKSGKGVQTFSGANAHTGGTTINEGTIKLTGDGALGSGAITINSNAMLEIEASETAKTLANNINGTGTVKIFGSAGVTLSGTVAEGVTIDAVAKIGNTYYATFNDAITAAEADATITILKNTAEAITFTKNITIAGTATLSGYLTAAEGINVTISSGKITLAGANGNFKGTFTVDSGAELETIAKKDYDWDITVPFGKGNIVNNGTVTITDGPDTAALIPPMSGSGNLVLNRSARLAAALTITGTITIANGCTLTVVKDTTDFNGHTPSINGPSIVLNGALVIATTESEGVATPDGTVTIATGEKISGAGTVTGDITFASGATDTRWYDSATGNEYTIKTVVELSTFAKLVTEGNTFAGKTVTLGANIDLTGYTWPGIGVYDDTTSENANDKAFQGIFNGNNNTISNVTFANTSANRYRGFFNQIFNATVTNLTVDVKGFDANTEGTYGGAAIAGHANSSTIENCVATGSFTATHNVAGIVVRISAQGAKDSLIKGCVNKADLSSNYTKIGGIAALSQSTVAHTFVIENCRNEGALTSTRTDAYTGDGGVGGIIGWLGYSGSGTIKNCVNRGEITETTSGYITLGQIAGQIDTQWTIEGDANSGFANMLAEGEKAVDGLNFATVTEEDGKQVATYVKNAELAAGETYLVTAKEAKPSIKLAAGQAITFDTSLAPIDGTLITAAYGVTKDDSVANAVTYTARLPTIDHFKTELLASKKDGNYVFDGQGKTYAWTIGNVVNNGEDNAPNAFNSRNAQYFLLNGETGSVTLSNVKFVFTAPTEAVTGNINGTGSGTAVNAAQLYFMNTGDFTVENCTFDKVVLTNFCGQGATTITGCTFANCTDTYAMKDIRGKTITVTGNKITNCSGGVMVSAVSADTEVQEVAISGNTFSGVGTGEGITDRGLVQLAATGVYAEDAVKYDATTNTTTNCGATFWQLNTSAAPQVQEMVDNNDDLSMTENSITVVCKIGSTNYKTLQDAIAAANGTAEEPAVITFLTGTHPLQTIGNIDIKNIVITAEEGAILNGILVDKTLHPGSNPTVQNLTIEGVDFEGYGFRFNLNNQATFWVVENLTMNNCTYKGTSTTDVAGNRLFDVGASSIGSNLFINLKITNCTVDTAIQGVQLGGLKGNIVLTDNKISNVGHNAIALRNIAADATVTVANNTITNGGDRAFRAKSVGTGAKIYFTKNTLKNCGDSGDKSNYKDDTTATAPAWIAYKGNTLNDALWNHNGGVAQNGDTYYSTLAFAIEDAAAGDTVTLIADVTEEGVKVAEGKTATIDLAEKTVNGSFMVYGLATIKNGTIANTNGSVSAIENNGATSGVTLEDLTVTSARHAVRIDGGTTTIKSGSYKTVATEGTVHAINISTAATVVIDGGTFTGYGAMGFGGSALATRDNGTTVTINGGTFSNDGGPYTIAAWGGILNITGGVFHKSETDTLNMGGGSNGTSETGISGGYFEDKPDTKLLQEGKAAYRVTEGTYANWFGIADAVAKIGEEPYASLTDAITAAVAGDTVTLLANIVMEAKDGTSNKVTPIIEITKNLTLDLNGKTISLAKKESVTGIPGVIYINNGANVTIAGEGKIDAECGNNGAYGIHVFNGSVTIKAATVTGAPTAVSVITGSATIEGGHYELATTCAAANVSTKNLINCLDANYTAETAGITITGGSFKNWNPSDNAAEGDYTNFATEGYIGTLDANGNYILKEGSYVARAAGTQFETLTDAIAAAEAGSTVTLVANVVMEAKDGTSNKVTPIIEIKKDLTLDLNGKTISLAKKASVTGIPGVIYINNGANVTIAGNGKIDAECGNNGAYGIHVFNGSVTIEAATVTGAPTAVSVITGSATIEGGHYELAATCAAANVSTTNLINCLDANYTAETAGITITGGSFKNWNPSDNAAEGDYTNFATEGYIGTLDANGNYILKEGSYVVRAAGKQFETLTDAIAAAEAGSTVTVIADIEVPVVQGTSGKQTPLINITKSITLDLNKKTISLAAPEGGNVTGIPVILNIAGATVTITGEGTIDGTCGNNAVYAVDVDSNGSLIIKNGTYIGYATAVQATAGKVTIENGTFTLTEIAKDPAKNPYGSSFLINCVGGSGSSITISGGKYYDFNPADNDAEGEYTGFAPGMIGVYDAETKFYTLKKGVYVARTGGKQYETLEAAIEAAVAGDTVTLLADVVLEAKDGTTGVVTPIVEITKNLTLDLNGKTISLAEKASVTGIPGVIYINNGANVTIAGEGKIDAECGNNGAYGIHVFNGSVTIKAATVTGAPTAVSVITGSANIEGGHYELAATCAAANVSTTNLINCLDANYTADKADITITGGSFKNWNPSDNAAEGNYTNFVQGGYIGTADANGNYTLKEGSYVARAAGKQFETLAEAIDAAKAANDTVKVLTTTATVPAGVTAELKTASKPAEGATALEVAALFGGEFDVVTDATKLTYTYEFGISAISIGKSGDKNVVFVTVKLMEHGEAVERTLQGTLTVTPSTGDAVTVTNPTLGADGTVTIEMPLPASTVTVTTYAITFSK